MVYPIAPGEDRAYRLLCLNYDETQIYQDPLVDVRPDLSCDNSVSSTEVVDKHDISIYPNPSENNIRVKLRSNIKMIKLYDQSGRTVKIFSLPGTSEIQLDVHDISKGRYILYIETTDGIIHKSLTIQ